ncbi:MAG: hypothetical protein R3E86_13815 [Pseudomonadales bacterium]
MEGADVLLTTAELERALGVFLLNLLNALTLGLAATLAAYYGA